MEVLTQQQIDTARLQNEKAEVNIDKIWILLKVRKWIDSCSNKPTDMGSKINTKLTDLIDKL